MKRKSTAPPSIVTATPSPPLALNFATSVIKSADFKDIYTNSSRISISPFDMSMMFGRTIELSPTGHAVEDLAHVRMSPYQFKIFVQAMVNTLEAWEAAFGALPEVAHSASAAATKEGVMALKKAVMKSA